MPTRRRPTRPSWLIHGAPVKVQVTDSATDEDFISCNLFVKYDENKEQGVITLRLPVQLTDSDSAQALSLVIYPENIDSISSDPVRVSLPPTKLQTIYNHVPAITGDMLVLSITLKSPGRVLCPVPFTALAPTTASKNAFDASSRLCTTTKMRVYLVQDQLSPNDIERLQDLVDLACQGELASAIVDLNRLGGGRGLYETDWSTLFPSSESFHAAAPPPYVQNKPVSSSPSKRLQNESLTSCSKRSRAELSTPSPPPSCSSTIPDTPDSLRGVSHAAKRSIEAPSPADLARMVSQALKAELRGLVREEMTDVLRSVLPGVVKSSMAEVFKGSDALVGTVAQAKMDTLDELIGKHLEAKLPALVAPALEPALESTLDTFADQLNDDQKATRLELEELVEDSKVELHMTRDEGIKEMENKLDELNQEAENIIEGLEDVGTEKMHMLDAKGDMLFEEMKHRHEQQMKHCSQFPAQYRKSRSHSI